MVQTACFSREQLRDFSLGCISAEEEARMAAHLDQCESCQQAAAECDRSADSLVEALRLSDEALSADDIHCDAALARAKQLAAASVDARHERTEPIRLREYELLRKLGEGGMGTVYLARHTRLDRIVALKILPPDRMRDSSAVARFEREMRAVGGLDHPAIVRATDAGDVDGTHFLVMEYVEGLDLSSLAERMGPIGIADACELVRQAALGLQHVHERGMVHRDIKPSNLMLTPRGEVKILDLGLALLQPADGELHGITTVGRFMGTLDYMPPEQADDSHEVDIRADVYGLGATLYRLICGVPPFAGNEYRSPLKKLKALATEPVPPLRKRRPDVPAALAQVIERMLAKDPADRFATPAEVAEALAPFTSGSDLVALQRTAAVGQVSNLPEQATSQPHETPQRRKSRFRLGLIVALVAFAGSLAVAAIYIQTDKGRLVIKSPDPGIEVLIRRGGKPVDDWELQRGENGTIVRSGSYEIVLIGETDGLRVKDGTFALTRGGEHVATIERVEAKTARSSDLLKLGQQPVAPDAPDAESQRISQRNLRRLGIAMHAYHDKRNHFPPAVVLGPDGKTPHSWRVALLPHLGHEDLYEQYRLDEPWDSEHNKGLLENMPDVYRHPTAAVETTNAAYFVITSPTAAAAARAMEGMAGAGYEEAYEEALNPEGGLPPDESAPPAQRFDALFSSVPQKTGPRIRDITDGTSNVLLIVEGRRDVPWTRPEDIPYRPGAAPPRIGGRWEGGLYAAFADGDVRFVADSVDRETLRKLIAPADGHPVDLKSLGAPLTGRAQSARPVAPAAFSDRQALQGTWEVVAGDSSSESRDFQGRTFRFDPNEFVIWDGKSVEAKGPWMLHPPQQPQTIILSSIHSHGRADRKIYWARYELNGDRLRLVISEQKSPTDFEPDKDTSVLELRRTARPDAQQVEASQPPTKLVVFTLAHADAADMAAVAQQLVPGIRATPDKRTNTLLVQASEEDLQKLETIIRVLDRELPAKSRREEENLQGVWEFKGLQDGGRSAPVEVMKNLKFILGKERFQFWEGDRIDKQGTYELDPTAEPKTITFFEEGAEKPTRGIYRLEEEKLWITLNEIPGGERPNAFVSERGSPNDTLMELRQTKEPVPPIESGEESERAEKDAAHRGGPSQRIASAEPSPLDETSDRISFNFNHAPWPDVIKLLAEATGLTLDMRDVPPGTFSYRDRKQYTPSEALHVLNGFLVPDGYVLVRRGDVLVLLKIGDGRDGVNREPANSRREPQDLQPEDPLGLSLRLASPRELGSQTKYRGGLVVEQVRPSSPASAAGVRAGDVLVGLGEWETTTIDNFHSAVQRATAANLRSLKFYMLRDGETVYGTLTLPDASADDARSPKSAAAEHHHSEADANWVAALLDTWNLLGLELEPTESDEGPGLKVLRVRDDSPASQANLRRGDVLREASDRKLRNLASFGAAVLAAARTGADSLQFSGLRGDEPLHGSLPVPKQDVLASWLWHEYGVTPKPVAPLTAKLLEWIGLHLSPIGRDRFRGKDIFPEYTGGLNVTSSRTNGPAWNAGIQGIVVGLQGRPVTTLKDLDSAMKHAVEQISRGEAASLQFQILRSGKTVQLDVPVPDELRERGLNSEP